jgi:hypothetical protein
MKEAAEMTERIHFVNFGKPIGTQWCKDTEILLQTVKTTTQEIFDNLVQTYEGAKCPYIRAKRKLQSSIQSQITPSFWKTQYKYLTSRFSRWGDARKEIVQFRSEIDAIGPKVVPRSVRFAWLRFWFNAFFTAKRFQKGEEKCRFCGEIELTCALGGESGYGAASEQDSLEHIMTCRVVNDIVIGLDMVWPSSITGTRSWYGVYKARSLKFCFPHWFRKAMMEQGAGRPSIVTLKYNRDRSFLYINAALYDVHNSLRARDTYLHSVEIGVNKCRSLFKEYGWGVKKEKKRRAKSSKRAGGNPLALAIRDDSESE